MTPELHATLLACASVASLLFAGVMVARNPRSVPARMHALYGAAVGWWFLCAAFLAAGNDFQRWGRLAHLSIAMLPAIIYHLNAATVGVARRHRRAIRVHYALSGLVTVYSVSRPIFHDVPNQYSWGPYMAYSWTGLILIGFLVVVFAEVFQIYRSELKRAEKGSVLEAKLGAFLRGNIIAGIVLIDFLPVYGFAVYPLGFLVLTAMNAATMFGAVRYRLIQITHEFAAEQILETLPDAVIVVDTRHVVRLANKAAVHAFGRDLALLVDSPLAEVVDEPQLLEALSVSAAQPASVRELLLENRAGGDWCIRLSDRQVVDQRGAPVARVWLLHDVTAERHAEVEKERFADWVREAKRLESLGLLAGGIAHDFNNLLTVILGQAEIASARCSDTDGVAEPLASIVMAAERAAELTDQMLTYAGRADTVVRPFDLNGLVREMGELLHVATPKGGELGFELTEGLPLVAADQGQMSQVILNLITNASDSLGDASGTITLRTGICDVESSLEPELDSAMPHVFFAVADTGVGMDDETKRHVFDPFYTTKSTGRGLGLATAFGIVQAHGGSIRVESEAGKGTLFTVALPRSLDQTISVPDPSPLPSPWHATGVALVVDDEDEVRRVAREMVAATGFDVIEAVNGERAIEHFIDRQSEISFVLLDVTMPGVDGVAVLRSIRARSTSVPVILMSGYAEINQIGIEDDPWTWFLKKPFRSVDMTAVIREAMPSERVEPA